MIIHQHSDSGDEHQERPQDDRPRLAGVIIPISRKAVETQGYEEVKTNVLDWYIAQADEVFVKHEINPDLN